MAQDPSFDIVSKIEKPELDNAISQAMAEIHTRFDFKGSKSSITAEKEHIVILSDNEIKLKQVIDVFTTKLSKRGISAKAFQFDGKVEPATGATVRLKVKVQNGLSQDETKKITKLIKDSNLKVQAQIMGDMVRVTGKKRDDLQEIMSLIKKADFPFDASFTNFK